MSLSQDIESRINILDIVNRYVQTKKAWVNYKWLCPFHSEKSPSFIISPQKNIAHCFSCGKGGGPIRFLMEVEKIEFREAVQILAKEAGIELKTDFQREKQEKWADIYALYRETAQWYHDALFLQENAKYLNYLLDRQISLETIRKFQLGCSTAPRDLWFFLKEKWFDPKFIIESGIFVGEGRDKFFWRIVFPIANSMGHVVAFTGRVLDTSLPKYLNSPASHIFDKSSILYGMHLAKQVIAKSGKVFVVEGQMDTIALHQAGVDNAVGISGTALTSDHIRMLKRFSKTIFLVLDSDDAGVKATFASIENLQNQDIEVRIIRIPNGKDPDEFLKSGGTFSELEANAISPIAFYLVEGKRNFDIATIIGKKKLLEKCLEFVVPIKSQIEIDMYISEMSSAIGVGKDAIFSEYKKMIQAARYKKTDTSFDSGKVSDESWEDSFQSPSMSEILAAYIRQYSFLDLFFREFQYTLSDLSLERDFSLLSAVVSSQTLDLDQEERIKVIMLSLENLHSEEDMGIITKVFLDLIKKLHAILLVHEKNRLFSENSAGDDVILLKIRQNLVQKAIQLGISPSVLK